MCMFTYETILFFFKEYFNDLVVFNWPVMRHFHVFKIIQMINIVHAIFKKIAIVLETTNVFR